MEEVDDAGFEDFSISTTLEKLAFAAEEAVDRWLKALTAGSALPGLTETEPSTEHVVALEGVVQLTHCALQCSIDARILVCGHETIQACAVCHYRSSWVTRRALIAACRAVIEHKLPFRKTPYLLALHLPKRSCANTPSSNISDVSAATNAHTGQAARPCFAAAKWWPRKRFGEHASWADDQSKFHTWFGVDAFLTVRRGLIAGVAPWQRAALLHSPSRHNTVLRPKL